MIRSGQRGFALVGVLWVGLLLTVIAGSILYTVRMQSYSARSASNGAAAEYLAEAGVSVAVDLLYKRLREREWRADNTAEPFELPGGKVVVSILDEGGKIDLNRSSEALLQSLFEANGLAANDAAALAGAVADWRDQDDDVRLNGAEKRHYLGAGRNWGPKNAAFQRVDELRRVLGMTPDLFTRVAPAVTVHSGRPGVDIEVAPRVVLRALPGLDDATLDRIEARTEGPERIRLIREAVTDKRALANSSRLSYTVRAEAQTETGATYVREAIVSRIVRSRGRRGRTQPYSVLDWKRGRPAAPETEEADPAVPRDRLAQAPREGARVR